jgi:Tol biopolymer transport system component
MASCTACTVIGALVVAALAAPSARAVQDTIRTSVDSAGTQGNHDSTSNGVSADGRIVAFQSQATNLVAGDKNYAIDVFVFDRATGTTERVSVDSAGNEQAWDALAESTQLASGDGSLIAFTSGGVFDPGDTNHTYDIFIRDRGQGTTTRVSVDSAGNQCHGNCRHAALSQDGGGVAFESIATDLVSNDTNNAQDIFFHDLAAGTTERVSVDSTGIEGDDHSWEPSICADGSCVAFCGKSTNLVPGDTNGNFDVFVRNRVAGTTERASVDSSGQQGNGDSEEPAFSADGNCVAFSSWATNLVAGDNNGHEDVFVHDRTTGTTMRVSVSSSGQEGDEASYRPALSADGRFVLFTSFASNLVAGDTNANLDVFVHDRSTGTTTRVSVDSGGGQADFHVWGGGISADGGVASFWSGADDLVASDTNYAADVFVHEMCSTPASWTSYGAGYPGTHGVPSFTSQQFPSFGATVTVDLANSYGAPTVGFLALGFQRASLPTNWGGDLLTLPFLIAPITFSYGLDSFTGTLPDDIALCGTTIDLQGIEADPGATFGLSFSAGLELVIGS